MTTAAAPPAPNVALPQVPYQHVADIELPREVQGLYELAYNLWWTWNPKAIDLFAAIDSRAWSHYHNPVQMLINVERRQWEHLIDNDTFLEAYSSLLDDFQAYMSGAARAWFHGHATPNPDVVRAGPGDACVVVPLGDVAFGGRGNRAEDPGLAGWSYARVAADAIDVVRGTPPFWRDYRRGKWKVLPDGLLVCPDLVPFIPRG